MHTKEIYEIGEIPPVGEVPKSMYAQLIRANRFGEPTQAFKVEKIPVPDLKPDEVLVYVMAAGINFNNVWAALGSPVNVIAARQKSGYDPSDFHIGGSDASGIVYAVGADVKRLKVGDRVVIHCGVWDPDCPAVKAGEDPMFDPSYKIWGYETNWGSFAQFTKVQAHQCMPKAAQLTWEEAAAPTLVGATAYRMLMAWPPHTVRANDLVLIWGASGGLGCMAIQIVKAQGAIPVGVVGDDRKIDFCMQLGAKGTINRRRRREAMLLAKAAGPRQDGSRPRRANPRLRNETGECQPDFCWAAMAARTATIAVVSGAGGQLESSARCI